MHLELYGDHSASVVPRDELLKPPPLAHRGEGSVQIDCIAYTMIPQGLIRPLLIPIVWIQKFHFTCAIQTLFYCLLQ